jgi:hypothetical protein
MDQGSDLDRLVDEAKFFVGRRVAIKDEDYGVVVDVVCVVKNDVTFVVVVTDRNRRVEARSFISNVTSYTGQKVYPDGSAFSKRFAGPKALYSARPALAGSVATSVRINHQVINICSHLSSSDVCDSDNKLGK